MCDTPAQAPTSAMQLLMCVSVLLRMEAEDSVHTSKFRACYCCLQYIADYSTESGQFVAMFLVVLCAPMSCDSRTHLRIIIRCIMCPYSLTILPCSASRLIEYICRVPATEFPGRIYDTSVGC